MISFQQGYFDPNMMIIYEMLNIKLQIQQNFDYIVAEINKIAQYNKFIEANKKDETAREILTFLRFSIKNMYLMLRGTPAIYVENYFFQAA